MQPLHAGNFGIQVLEHDCFHSVYELASTSDSATGTDKKNKKSTQKI